MSVKMRQLVEREICTVVVDALLAGAFKLAVDNGGDDFEISDSSDRAAILDAMFATDEERLYAAKEGIRGWVYFVYGNDGWDVISDYTVNLESFIGEGTAVQKIVDKYAD